MDTNKNARLEHHLRICNNIMIVVLLYSGDSFYDSIYWGLILLRFFFFFLFVIIIFIIIYAFTTH